MPKTLGNEKVEMPTYIRTPLKNEATPVERSYHINRKQDRFTISERYKITGTSKSGKTWMRWSNHFTISASIKTPAYTAVPTLNVFASHINHFSGIVNITANGNGWLKRQEERIRELFIEELTDLANRNHFDISRLDLIDNPAKQPDLAVALLAYPMLSKESLSTGSSLFSSDRFDSISRIIATPARFRTAEELCANYSITNEPLKELISSTIKEQGGLSRIELTKLELLSSIVDQSVLFSIFTAPPTRLMLNDEEIAKYPAGVIRSILRKTSQEYIEKIFTIETGVRFKQSVIDTWRMKYKPFLRACKEPLSSLEPLEILNYIEAASASEKLVTENMIKDYISGLDEKLGISYSFKNNSVMIKFPSNLIITLNAKETTNGEMLVGGVLHDWCFIRKGTLLYETFNPFMIANKHSYIQPTRGSGYPDNILAQNIIPLINSYITLIEKTIKAAKVASTPFNYQTTEAFIFRFARNSHLSRFEGKIPTKLLKLVNAGMSPELSLNLVRRNYSYATAKEMLGLPESWVNKLIGVEKEELFTF